ncbi:homeobox-leucine zipper protein ROC8-like [Hordeum vulgare subsp. vulgare]|uniref:homeobox-leucine zipper protein ROC8-like n=1 Tax=Hordeum vulgare subsp. vulgare TaxID=112509 RepID=UPI000B46F516|nr:homeobox-leucine zipper protein ROC8-like [Hordeum vulgare subsp. vulgare]
MDLGDHQEGVSDNQQLLEESRKSQRRHTPEQIQKLEESFQTCAYPDEAQSAQLGRELGLDTKQIRSWFQNHRTQMKVEYERAENLFLREENTRILSENMVMREALKTFVCLNPNCTAKHYFDQQEELNKENARLKAGLLRCATSFQDEL